MISIYILYFGLFLLVMSVIEYIITILLGYYTLIDLKIIRKMIYIGLYGIVGSGLLMLAGLLITLMELLYSTV